MRIGVHIVVLWIILAISFVHGSGDLSTAQYLSLISGSARNFIELAPIVFIAIYILFVLGTRRSRKPSVWMVGGCVAIISALAVIYYPDWVVQRYTQRIGIGQFIPKCEMFLPKDVVSRFEQKFGTRAMECSTSRGGPWLIVRRDSYSPEMVDFLKQETLGNAEPVATEKERQR